MIFKKYMKDKNESSYLKHVISAKLQTYNSLILKKFYLYIPTDQV